MANYLHILCPMQLAYKCGKCRYVRFVIQLRTFASASNYSDTRIILKILNSKATILSFDNLVKGHTLQVQYNRSLDGLVFHSCGYLWIPLQVARKTICLSRKRLHSDKNMATRSRTVSVIESLRTAQPPESAYFYSLTFCCVDISFLRGNHKR